MIKDTTTITTYKFTSFAEKTDKAKKLLKVKFPIEFKASDATTKNLNVKQYRVTDILNRVN